METIEPACRQDLPEVERLYRQLCDEQAGDPYTPMWEYGLHPDTEMLERHIENGELWIARVDGMAAGAMALVPEGGNREDLGLHLLGITRQFRGTGLSQRMLDVMDRETRTGGYRTQVLDVIAGNIRAERLYRRRGFEMTGRSSLQEGDRLLRFHLYRRDMQEG